MLPNANDEQSDVTYRLIFGHIELGNIAKLEQGSLLDTPYRHR